MLKSLGLGIDNSRRCIMADVAKRNSVAGNKAQVATPKSATPTPDNGAEAIEKAIGAR